MPSRSPRSALLELLGLIIGVGGCAPILPVSQTPAGLLAGERQVEIQGVRQWYRVTRGPAPDGLPIVFLHGGPGQGSVHFEELAGPALEPRLRMVYYDQRGSGRSEKPQEAEAYSIPILVEDIEGLRRALGVERMVLVGHSFGGLLALEYAATHPEAVAGLAVVSGLWSIPRQCRLRLETLRVLRPEAFARVAADTLSADGCALESQAFASQEAREVYNLEAMHLSSAVQARIDSVNAAHGTVNTGEMGRSLFGSGALDAYEFDRFERLTMPVLVIGGLRDGVTRPEGLRDLAERLPHGRFVAYPASGHFPYLNEPERFAVDLAAFVRDLK